MLLADILLEVLLETLVEVLLESMCDDPALLEDATARGITGGTIPCIFVSLYSHGLLNVTDSRRMLLKGRVPQDRESDVHQVCYLHAARDVDSPRRVLHTRVEPNLELARISAPEAHL